MVYMFKRVLKTIYISIIITIWEALVAVATSLGSVFPKRLSLKTDAALVLLLKLVDWPYISF